MEALSRSFVLPKLPERQSSLINTIIDQTSHKQRCEHWIFPKITSPGRRSCLLAVSHEVSDDGEDEQIRIDNGFCLLSQEIPSSSEGNLSQVNTAKDVVRKSEFITLRTASYGTGDGTRAGLFRTPISGGVQSTTSAHDLPRPALAVRNLMEQEYEALRPDKIAADGGEQNLKELNAIFSKPLKDLLSSEAEIDDAALISIDSKGIDIRVRQGAQFNIQRLSFEEGHAVETLEEAKAALWKLMNKDRAYNLQK